MAKTYYELVGSIYNKYAKGNKYQEEEVVKIDGIALDSLEAIDRFTAPENLYTISKKLPIEYQDKNQFAIRCSTNDHTVYYQRVIFNQPELVEVIDQLQKKMALTSTGYKNLKLVPVAMPLVQRTLKPIEQAVTDRNLGNLSLLLPDEGDFAWHVRRYLNADSSEASYGLGMTELMQEARHYSNFRKILVHQMKQPKKGFQLYQPKKINTAMKITRKNSAATNQTVSIPPFNEEGYVERQTAAFNQQTYYGREFEEFLTSEEVDAAISFNDEGPEKHGRR